MGSARRMMGRREENTPFYYYLSHVFFSMRNVLSFNSSLIIFSTAQNRRGLYFFGVEVDRFRASAIPKLKTKFRHSKVGKCFTTDCLALKPAR